MASEEKESVYTAMTALESDQSLANVQDLFEKFRDFIYTQVTNPWR